MTTLNEQFSNVVEAFAGNKGKALFELSMFVIDEIKNKKDAFNKKLELLMIPDVDQSWQYSETILKNYVGRRYEFYKSKKKVTLNKIKHEIEYQRLARNVILTGLPGVGKTTALKWLFVNSNAPGYSYVYLSARMFSQTKNLEEISIEIEKAISGRSRCLIFFDGLDELNCVKGHREELEAFINMFNQKSRHVFKNSNHKFVISTRPEHFDFHEMIRKNKTKKSLDNYVVFEILPLNSNESFKVCKSIKKLSQFDHKKEFTHFINKWPLNDRKTNLLTEKDYLKLLSAYIHATDESSSLLASPLLCRYAYQIICGWNQQNNSGTHEDYKTQTSRIEKVLEYCIKWEFHDQHTEQTANASGKRNLEIFKNKVFNFLEQIAGVMGTNNFIEKEQWRKLKNIRKIEANAALCVLQEYDGNLTFIHESFKEYFLSRYYVSVMNKEPNEDTIDKFASFIESSLAFTTMYLEQLLQRGNVLSKKICVFLMKTYKNYDINRISQYARGDLYFLYNNKTIPFTIEEYLTVFPKGKVIYAGCMFDKKYLKELIKTGILEIENPDNLVECKQEIISNNARITAVQLIRSNEFKLITLNFICVIKNRLVHIGGYWQSSFTKDDFIRILHKTELAELLSKKFFTIEAIMDSALLSIILWEKKTDDAKKKEHEYNKLNSWINNIVDFLGHDNNYWCFFDGLSLYVYQITKKNEKYIENHFIKGLSSEPIDYIVLYGEYKATTENENELVQSSGFNRIENIPISFDSNKDSFGRDKSCLSIYYQLHWRNIKLLKMKRTQNAATNDDKTQFILSVREIFELYKCAESLFEEFHNEKLKLLISDEKLITFYLLGEGDKMVELAENTFEFCEQFSHSLGKNFREFLIDDNTCFSGEDLNKVYEFSYGNIWI